MDELYKLDLQLFAAAGGVVLRRNEAGPAWVAICTVGERVLQGHAQRPWVAMDNLYKQVVCLRKGHERPAGDEVFTPLRASIRQSSFDGDMFSP